MTIIEFLKKELKLSGKEALQRVKNGTMLLNGEPITDPYLPVILEGEEYTHFTLFYRNVLSKAHQESMLLVSRLYGDVSEMFSLEEDNVVKGGVLDFLRGYKCLRLTKKGEPYVITKSPVLLGLSIIPLSLIVVYIPNS